jgi:hypothetical protein
MGSVLIIKTEIKGTKKLNIEKWGIEEWGIIYFEII